MPGSSRVRTRVGCDRNGTSHVRVESLHDVLINYVTQPRSQGTMMATTPGTIDVDVVANVKP
jgi:hypothetical protein